MCVLFGMDLYMEFYVDKEMTHIIDIVDGFSS